MFVFQTMIIICNSIIDARPGSQMPGSLSLFAHAMSVAKPLSPRSSMSKTHETTPCILGSVRLLDTWGI
jgi:hypothetical protein